jgi:hypothetical protein
VSAPQQSSGNDEFAFGLSVAIAFVFSAIAAFVGGWLGRRKLMGDMQQLRSEMDEIKRTQSLDRARAAVHSDGGRQTGLAGTVQRPDRGPAYATVPRSVPTGGAPDSSGGYGIAHPPLAEQPVSPPPIAVQPLLDPAEQQRQAEMLRRHHADQAVQEFQAQFQQFLAGANVSQKAYDGFVSQHGRTLMVQSIDGTQVHLTQDATGTEKLLALQLTGHDDRVILLPSFYFISDFSSSFARSRDVPREIKAGYDIVGGGNGQLRINRLGLLRQNGEAWVLAEPRGELAGFVD